MADTMDLCLPPSKEAKKKERKKNVVEFIL